MLAAAVAVNAFAGLWFTVVGKAYPSAVGSDPDAPPPTGRTLIVRATTFMVLEGTLVLNVAGERVEVIPGGFCCFPEGVKHAVIDEFFRSEPSW